MSKPDSLRWLKHLIVTYGVPVLSVGAALIISCWLELYFVAPIYSLAVETVEMPRVVLFSLVAFFVGFLSAKQRSAAEAARLFEPFYTTKPNRLGMGLSISRSIIDSHRGRLWATANPDHGATFHLALPGMR